MIHLIHLNNLLHIVPFSLLISRPIFPLPFPLFSFTLFSFTPITFSVLLSPFPPSPSPNTSTHHFPAFPPSSLFSFSYPFFEVSYSRNGSTFLRFGGSWNKLVCRRKKGEEEEGHRERMREREREREREKERERKRERERERERKRERGG